MRIVCISDTHTKHWELKIPDGDILIHAGDFTAVGKPDQIIDFNAWLHSLPHKHKIVIAGNHDFMFEKDPGHARMLLWAPTHFLENSGCNVEGLKFWGSPQTPWFHNWAFNVTRGPQIHSYWNLIPQDTDVLITHGPPHGILDRTLGGEDVGCEALLARILDVSPKLHVFGHIHEAAGNLKTPVNQYQTLFVNAAVLDRRYEPNNRIQVIEYQDGNFKVVLP